jgi:hypothetical protein
MGSKVHQLLGARPKELSAVRDEWLTCASSTSPADREEAEFGIALAYDAVGLPAPDTILWAPDPAVGAFAAAELIYGQGARHVEKLIWLQPRDRTKTSINRTFGSRAVAHVLQMLRFPETSRAGNSATVAIRGLVAVSTAPAADSTHRPVESGSTLDQWTRRDLWSHTAHDQLDRARRITTAATVVPPHGFVRSYHRTPSRGHIDRVLDRVVGRHNDLWDMAAFDVLVRVGGMRLDHLSGVVQVAKNAGWWWPLDGVAVVCERPSVAALDQRGRMHSETGPALAYPDGLSVYGWHGRVVPRWVVVEPTAERIGAEANAEVRRCAIEAMGWARFTDQAHLRLIDECPDPGNAGQRLRLYAVPGKVWGTPVGVLVCINGSVDLDGRRHTFGLLVPPNLRSALAAAAWGYGLTGAEYAQLQRRA